MTAPVAGLAQAKRFLFMLPAGNIGDELLRLLSSPREGEGGEQAGAIITAGCRAITPRHREAEEIYKSEVLKMLNSQSCHYLPACFKTQWMDLSGKDNTGSFRLSGLHNPASSQHPLLDGGGGVGGGCQSPSAMVLLSKPALDRASHLVTGPFDVDSVLQCISFVSICSTFQCRQHGALLLDASKIPSEKEQLPRDLYTLKHHQPVFGFALQRVALFVTLYCVDVREGV
ncbi:hypothetical protein INR49_005593 [Caranx melampygus]|nr:hypothetical protein INR49_005593 [Caranx melampygus]